VGLEPQISTVSVPRRQTHSHATRSSKSHRRTRLDGDYAPGDTHGAAPNRLCVLVQGGQGYGTKYATISAAPPNTPDNQANMFPVSADARRLLSLIDFLRPEHIK